MTTFCNNLPKKVLRCGRSNISSGLITFTYMGYWHLPSMWRPYVRLSLVLMSTKQLKTDSFGLFTVTRLIESMIQFTYNKLTSVFQFSYAFHTILITNLKIYNKLIVKGFYPGCDQCLILCCFSRAGESPATKSKAQIISKQDATELAYTSASWLWN